jgi:hypothetical protein
MILDTQGLAAAHESYAKTVGGMMDGHPMANAIQAYLAALPAASTELAARLRRIFLGDDHDRGCQGRHSSCSCGYDSRIQDAVDQAADAITVLVRRNAELEQANAALMGARQSLVATKCEQLDRLTRLVSSSEADRYRSCGQLLARAEAAEASAASARESALREALAAAKGCQITVPLAPGAADGASVAATQITDVLRAMIRKQEDEAVQLMEHLTL